MRRNAASLDVLLPGVVVLHLIVSLVHGAAHAGAAVPLSPNLFVLLVILVGPPDGLIVWRFGPLNHFVIPGTDHVAHIASSWRPMFAVTAVLLAIVEAFGSGIAIVSAIQTRRSS